MSEAEIPIVPEEIVSTYPPYAVDEPLVILTTTHNNSEIFVVGYVIPRNAAKNALGIDVEDPHKAVLTDGASYDKGDFSELYEAIGDQFSTEDTPEGEFQVPDYRARNVPEVPPNPADVGEIPPGSVES